MNANMAFAILCVLGFALGMVITKLEQDAKREARCHPPLVCAEKGAE